MHRFARQELESLKFKCKSPNCNKLNKYSAALSHIHTCEQQLQACPQGCGMGLHGQDFEYHFKIQCPNTKHICNGCEEDIFPNDPEQAPHDCIKTLKMLLAASRRENEALRQHGAIAPHNYGDLRRPQGARPEHEEDVEVEGTCWNGHALCAQYGSITEYNNVYCDLCHTTNLNDHEIFYRCGPCQYDVCLDCATGAGL